MASRQLELEWRLTRATEARFQELLRQLCHCSLDSDECKAIEEEIRKLPGFPLEAGMLGGNTFTRRILTDVQH